MCPVCLAMSGLYNTGGVSAPSRPFGHQVVAQATRTDRIDNPSTETEGDDHAATDDRVVIGGAAHQAVVT